MTETSWATTHAVDIAVGVALLVSAVRGYARGLFHEVTALAALLLAMSAAFRWTPTVVPHVAEKIPGPSFIDTPAAFFLIFAVTEIALRIVFSIAGRSWKGMSASPANRLGGVVFGMVKGGATLGSTMLILRAFTPAPLPNGRPNPFATPIQTLNASIERSSLAGGLVQATSGLFSNVVDAAEIRLRMLAASDNEGP
jgi:uncharacterized membrane protein required for colicin V production